MRATGSDQTLMDIAPSPARSRLQTAGERMVGFLVVSPGVTAGRIVRKATWLQLRQIRSFTLRSACARQSRQ